MTPRRGTWSVRGLDLAWHEWGPADGPVALCIHGFLDHGESWAFVAEILAAEGIRLVAPDTRGHGHSGWVGDGGYYHFYDYYLDLERLVRGPLGDVPFVLAGHSMGGSIATGLAALLGEQVRGLVLLEGMGPPFSDLDSAPDRLSRWTRALADGTVSQPRDERRASRRLMTDLEEAAERLRRMNPRLSEPRAERLAASFSEPTRGGFAWRYDPLHRTPAAKPYIAAEAQALWRSIQAPTLSLFGGRGLVPDNIQERHAHIPSVLVATVPDTGHNLHHERPEVIAAALSARVRDTPLEPPPGAVLGTPEGRDWATSMAEFRRP